MTMIVEDGSGVEAANSYASLEDALDYHLAHGSIDAWQRHVDAGRAAGGLLQATLKLDHSYVWLGVILSDAQGLRLPRSPFLDSDFRLWSPEMQISKAADATAALALQMLDSAASGGGTITSERYPDYSVTYGEPAVDQLAEIDHMLSGMFSAGGMSGGLRGAKLVRWS